ncbi:phospholipase D-like domain-containing protein [Paenibacillus sediminis]|uniref:Phosphatidylserine/phosphatidylglycerophosphate/ cardiolipin synthase-like enzyme n=1 Tax=Paenibacillus sediminis TaxID=664909 RepID=A0ABS4H4Y6_9BACL|nr:phospholipase D-like domain-containing protein [Paenibacillus sediminis]MBP1937589.1 phosphatidylserine/phosphatidylglycerophosphate/cardiolipin synthase-like enzyme [Paenibacillus sediminis]
MWIFWLYILNAIFMLIIAIREVRRPAKALNWLAIGLILPIIGFGLYLMIENPVSIRRERLTSPHNESDPLPDSFSRTSSIIAQSLRQLTVHGLRMGRVQMLTNGIETYDKLIESLQNAQSTIDVEYYIYRYDQIGKRITDVLIGRAESGVHIRFVRDGWGSRQFPRNQINRMIDAGIECRTIFPLRFPWIPTLTYRDHCKIVVIDGKEAFTGGINVGYEYTGLKPDIGFWRDTHMRIIGEAARDLRTIFDAHWNIASQERMKTKTPQKPAQDKRYKSQHITPSGRVALSGWSEEWGAEFVTGVDPIPGSEALHNAYIQTLESNPGIPTQVIRQAYFICLTQATHTIDIITPYFVPEADIIMALKTAVARGVRVRLLVPRRVIPQIVGPASRTYYGELLEAGVHIYMYEKGVVHAKVMIIDEEMAGIGSANYDMRSFRLNYEVIEMVYSADVARELTEQFERDLMDSAPLLIEELKQRSYPQRVIEQATRLFSPLL